MSKSGVDRPKRRPQRPKPPPADAASVKAVHLFLLHLLKAAEKGEAQSKAAYKLYPHSTTKGTWLYWQGVSKCLRWAISINRQRKPKDAKVNSARSD